MLQNNARAFPFPNPQDAVNPVLSQILTDAEMEHVRYFDLFNNVHYRNHPAKREQAAKRFALLKKCDELIGSASYTKKEIFDTYKEFENSAAKHYVSFLRKLKEFKQLGSVSCTHGRIGQKYEYKVNPFINAAMFQLLCDPHHYSSSQIAEWVNSTTKKQNEKYGTNYSTISSSTVSHYSLAYRNEINYYREGKSRFDSKNRSYLPRIDALNAGSLAQMDGSPVQMFCWNHPSKWEKEGKKLIRLNLFVLRDACTGKITGFDISESEDRFNVLNTLKMSAKLHGHLPAEIVHDNFSATKTDEFKAIMEDFKNKGVIVRAARVGNSQDKGEVERYFGTFQSRFQRLIDGYLGEGIMSKRANGRISKEFLDKCKKENGYYSYDEMMKIIAELVAIYNNSTVSKKSGSKTPNQLYRESEKPHVKILKDFEHIQLFWYNKKLKVSRGFIIHEVKKYRYIYEIWENEHKLQLNGKEVRVYYDEKDASEIHVFTLDGEFVCTCTQKIEVHEAAVDRVEGEELNIIKHEAHQNSIYKHIETKHEKRVKASEQYTGQDYEAVVPLTIEKEKLNGSESQALLNHFYDEKRINPNKIDERKPVKPATPYHDREMCNPRETAREATSKRKREKVFEAIK